MALEMEMELLCMFCRKGFLSPHELKSHLKKHFKRHRFCEACDGSEKRIDSTEFPREGHLCPKCQESPVSLKDQDVIESWLEEYLETTLNSLKRSDSHPTLKLLNMGCPSCDQLLTSANGGGSEKVDRTPRLLGSLQESQAKRHLRGHLAYNKFFCQLCDQRYPELCQILNHIRRHPPVSDKQRTNKQNFREATIEKLEQFIDHVVAYTRQEELLEKATVVAKELTRGDGGKYRFEPRVTRRTKRETDLICSFLGSNYKRPRVVLQMIPEEEAKKYRVIRDPGLIVGPEFMSTSNGTQLTDEEQEETPTYCCVFCFKKLGQRDEAVIHYQEHLEYKPIHCSHCPLVTTDTETLLTHHRVEHSIHKLKFSYDVVVDSLLEDWISSFLDSQEQNMLKAQSSVECCPVCLLRCGISPVDDTLEDDNLQLMTGTRGIGHVYSHLCYYPFECRECKRSGSTHRVAFVDTSSLRHLRETHNIFDKHEGWHYFEKSRPIPALDEFIQDYLRQFNIWIELYEPNTQRQHLKPKILKRRMVNENNGDRSGAKESKKVRPDLEQLLVRSQERNHYTEYNVVQKQGWSSIPLNGRPKSNCSESNDTGLGADLGYSDPESDSSAPIESTDPVKSSQFKALSAEYFCTFCPQTLETRQETITHFYDHFGLTSKDTPSDSTQKHHHCSRHGGITLMTSKAESATTRDWISDFVDCQPSLSKSRGLSCACSGCCPVCVKLKERSFSFPCIEYSEEALKSHIFEHLHYFPFRCMLCKENNPKRFSCLDSASAHLLEHNVHDLSSDSKFKHFEKAFIIRSLELFVDTFVLEKRFAQLPAKIIKLETAVDFDPSTKRFKRRPVLEETFGENRAQPAPDPGDRIPPDDNFRVNRTSIFRVEIISRRNASVTASLTNQSNVSASVVRQDKFNAK